MTIKETIKNSIIKTLPETQGDEKNFVVEIPADESKGDYACNVAMLIAKKLAKNPREVAEELISKLKNDSELALVIDTNKLEVAGPGFINFWIRAEYLKIFTMIEKIEVEKSLKGTNVLVEYSSPNIAKRFSVGHLRSTIIGNAIERLYRSLGANVTNDNHLGDWGTQFGMVIAAIEEKKLDVSKMSVSDLEAEYVEFNGRIAENPELKDKAREAFAKLESGDNLARSIWQTTVNVSMKEFNEIYKKLDVVFERNLGESVYEKIMPEIIQEAKEKMIATEGDGGAWIVKFEKEGKEYMPPAMLVKSNGTTTYFTRDLATIKWRLTREELKSDLYIYEVGSEQTLHMKQVFECAKLLWTEADKSRFVHVAHGMMTLPTGKMSTRKGNTIKLEDLLNRAAEEARLNSQSDLVDTQKMGINAVKFNELKRSPNANYVFRWEEALSMDGNSAPYINYAYVRARKILGDKKIDGFEGFFEGEELDLARFLIKYGEGEILEQAAKNFAPQIVCGYLFELARRFNAFYDHNRVLGDEREEIRLALVNMTASVLKSGMNNLGISLVEVM